MPMSPSTIFWVDTLVSLTAGLAALALLLLVMGVGLRQRLNQTFSLFAALTAFNALSAPITNIMLWLDFGNPHFWLELGTAMFYFVGPTLFVFAVVYVETLSDHPAPASAPSIEPWKSNWLKGLTALTLLAGFALLPMLFSHDIISQVYLDQDSLCRWELTQLGYVVAMGPFLFEALALLVFWQHRHQLGGTALVVSSAILLVGGLVGGLVRIPFPTVSLSSAISIAVMGYAVVSHQIFNPLRASTERLESEVAQRTHELQQARDKLQRLNDQRRTIAEISQEIAQAATPTDMLARLVELLHNRLGHPHVYFYQPDESRHYLVVQAAAGTTARTVLNKGDRLQIGGRSLAGQVATQHRPRIAESRGEDSVYFGETALPSARAEMALPILAGGQLLGVLDFQNIHWGAFSDEDLSVLMSLTRLVGATLYNARLLQETEAALAEVERVQRQYLRRAWRSVVGGPKDVPAYVYTDDDGVTTTSPSAVWSPAINQAVTTGRASIPASDQSAPSAEPAKDDQAAPSQTVALPITLRGQVIGALQLRHKTGRTWQPDDIKALGEVAERLGLALETARLSEETQRHGARESLIREITDQIQGATDLESLLRITAEELNKVLGASYTYVRMGTQEELEQA